MSARRTPRRPPGGGFKVRHEARFVVVGLELRGVSVFAAARDARPWALVYVGHVEWDVGRRTIEAVLAGALRRLRPTCEGAGDEDGVVWIEPRVEVEIIYLELMQGRLWDPVLRSLAGTSPL